MKRVLVDLLFFTGTKGGMESYVREVYSRFSRRDSELEYVALASRELAESGSSWFPGRVIVSRTSGENRVAWAVGELWSVARAARRYRADIVHCPANFGPVRSGVPTVLTVHDLLAFRHPEYVPGAYAHILRSMIRGAARSAEHILTVSRATRDDIVFHLGIPSDRITVAPLAGSAAASVPNTLPRHDAVLLAVGNRMPHKGFETLLEALVCIDAGARPRLIVPGGHSDDPLVPMVERLGLRDWVDLCGWMSHAELELLYAGATALVFPTRFEGFGLPVLEAMSRGCPVIVSDLPVTREVSGDAAIYMNPHDPESIAAAIRLVLTSPAERERMSRAGLSHAARFSWDTTAEATRAALLRVLADQI